MKYYALALVLALFAARCTPAADSPDDAIRTILPFDAIPAITDPQFVAATEAELDADTPVIGVTLDGESHAYSLYLLNGHEIVNDTLSNHPIATTW